MKTLVTIQNPRLLQQVMEGETRKRLEAISEVHWLQEGEALEELIGGYEAVISGWGSPKLTAQVL